MFHFALYITKENGYSNTLNFDSSNIEGGTVLYYILLDNYLEFFIPIFTNSSMLKIADLKNPNPQINDEKSSLWKSLSSTTTNFLNLSSSNKGDSNQTTNLPNYFDHINNNNSQRISSPMNENIRRSSMLNSKILSSNIFSPNVNTFNDPLTNDLIGSIVYKCETVLGRIFLKFNIFIYIKKYIYL